MVVAVSFLDDIDPARLVYRWDLDKTYLRTEFDTVRDLLKTALETPASKRTVPGAAVFLRELGRMDPAGIYILSGSPEQMRRVLEAKLRLDGIRWDAFTLKPSLNNLLRGKVRYLKDQVSYKLAALMSSRMSVDPDTSEVLFGDDAEADAVVYSLYADLCAGRVDVETLELILSGSDVYPEDIVSLLEMASRLPRHETVGRIFIHLERISAPAGFAELGARVCPFYNYFQPALVLVEDGLLEPAAALRVGAALVAEHGFPPTALGASFDDLSRRGYVGASAGASLLEALGRGEASALFGADVAIEAFEGYLQEKAPQLREPLPLSPPEVDYVGLFPKDRARAKAGKARATWRRG